MQNASPRATTWAAVAAPILHLERQFGSPRPKRGMMAMLTAWLGYFAIISMSVRSLNKVTVPLVDMPLGELLVAQGTAVVFLAALVLLVRTWGTTSESR